MISSNSHPSTFADYLDITASPDSDILDRVDLFLQSSGSSVSFSSDDSSGYSCMHRFNDNAGTVKLERKRLFSRVSASGSALASLRAHRVFSDYLSLLSSVPHKVTRLDAALDLPEDGSVSLARMMRKYPSLRVNLSRKSLPVTVDMGVRDDGKRTGTFYVGKKSRGRVTARMYDKAWERACVAKDYSYPPTTRYEITVRGDAEPTLRDASNPDSIFYHFACPTFFRRPPTHVTPWVSGFGGEWSYTPPERTPYEKLIQRVETSPDIEALIRLADSVGPSGRTTLCRAIKKRVMSSVE